MSTVNLPPPGKDDPRWYRVLLPAPYVPAWCEGEDEWEYCLAWSTPGAKNTIYTNTCPTNTKWARERIKSGVLRWRVGVLDYDKKFFGGWRYFEVTDEDTIRQVLKALDLDQ